MKKKINLLLASITLISFIYFVVSILKLNLLPTKYLILVLIFLAIIIGLILYKSFKSKSKILAAFSILITLLFLFVTPKINQLDSLISKITGHFSESHHVYTIVLKESTYESIEDVLSVVFGANTNIDEVAIIKSVDSIKNEYNENIYIKRYDNYQNLYDDFIDKSLEVMMISEPHLDFIEEIDEDFKDKIKIIHTFTYLIEEDLVDVDTTKETFSIFISGIDTGGSIDKVSRSDANIVLTINPLNNQVLMSSIPRDTFIYRHTNLKLDKLSLVGYSGIKETKESIEDLLQMDIDYTLKVNWTSVIKVVDALGGVEVYASESFSQSGYYFQKGYNYIYGDSALAFVTRRKGLEDGEDSRALNQQQLLIAIINKMLSPSIINNYSSFLSAIGDSIQLSMPERELNKLIKNQINTMDSWEILTQQIRGDIMETYDAYSAMGIYQIVKEPYEDILENAIKIIKLMEDNQKITKDMIKHRK